MSDTPGGSPKGDTNSKVDQTKGSLTTQIAPKMFMNLPLPETPPSFETRYFDATQKASLLNTEGNAKESPVQASTAEVQTSPTQASSPAVQAILAAGQASPASPASVATGTPAGSPASANRKGILRSRGGKVYEFKELNIGRDPASLTGKTILRWCDAFMYSKNLPAGVYFAIWLKEEPNNPILFRSHEDREHGWFHNWRKASIYLKGCRQNPTRGVKILEAACGKVVRVKRCMVEEGKVDMGTDQTMEEVWSIGIRLEGMDKMDWIWAEKMRPCTDVLKEQSDATHGTCKHHCDLFVIDGNEELGSLYRDADESEAKQFLEELGKEIYGPRNAIGGRDKENENTAGNRLVGNTHQDEDSLYVRDEGKKRMVKDVDSGDNDKEEEKSPAGNKSFEKGTTASRRPPAKKRQRKKSESSKASVDMGTQTGPEDV